VTRPLKRRKKFARGEKRLDFQFDLADKKVMATKETEMVNREDVLLAALQAIVAEVGDRREGPGTLAAISRIAHDAVEGAGR
jgi:hypothetical protein